MGIFGNAFSGWHLLLILAVVLLLFGASKLPGLAKSVGESVRILRSESTDAAAAGGDAASSAAPSPISDRTESGRPGPSASA
ncbi:sec-independent protein translocase protein TatA [Microbacterium sp. ru370.1]|uniref:twin-arginine translocase TatA/TatE family subunit n=1 Tax=unclassified Microbacterium TaxID=2609290 RepID=UPI0008835D5F|nr:MULTISPECIES: twin-arginine translocase TatA/TatE family subunit [unclassified Microbacterium]SDO46993.1 sec-independent protein translocase protein TatA [Microbacterium sp. ru370.1]SIT81942.1 sec-independent protein translocase protein TatA [Microbacterium sp. RU1D]